jgi:hypothetical protein
MQLMPAAVLLFEIVLTSGTKERQCGRMQVVISSQIDAGGRRSISRTKGEKQIIKYVGSKSGKL